MCLVGGTPNFARANAGTRYRCMQQISDSDLSKATVCAVKLALDIS